jgi:hypothetical protein
MNVIPSYCNIRSQFLFTNVYAVVCQTVGRDSPVVAILKNYLKYRPSCILSTFVKSVGCFRKMYLQPAKHLANFLRDFT